MENSDDSLGGELETSFPDVSERALEDESETSFPDISEGALEDDAEDEVKYDSEETGAGMREEPSEV